MADTAALQKLVASEDTFGFTMLVICIELFDEPFYDWDPEAIRLELEGSLRTKCDEAAFNRLMGALYVVNEESFYKSLPDFIKTVNALSDGLPPSAFELPDAYDLAWGITEALLLSPPDSNDEAPFADDIVNYIGAALDFEGITAAPDVLRLGLRADADDLLGRVHAEFADDPTLTQAIMETQRSKTDDIELGLRNDLKRLLSQLQAIGSDRITPTIHSMLAAMQRQNDHASQLQLSTGSVR